MLKPKDVFGCTRFPCIVEQGRARGAGALTSVYRFGGRITQLRIKIFSNQKNNVTKIMLVVLGIRLFCITNSLFKLLSFLLGRGSSTEVEKTK